MTKRWEDAVPMTEREAVARRFFDEWAEAEESSTRWRDLDGRTQLRQIERIFDFMEGKVRFAARPYERMLERALRAEGFEVPE